MRWLVACLLIIVKYTFIYCGLFVFSYSGCFGTAFDFDLLSFRLFLTKQKRRTNSDMGTNIL